MQWITVKGNTNHEIFVISIIVGIFIYFRRLDYYATMPRKSFVTAIVIALWTYLSLFVSVWFVVIGLVALNMFGKKHNKLYS